ncbi:hypothetical protein E2320_009289 [Naja naja]|nr:hypothetical protein E2320_009289 [Naja naja]
MFLPSVHLSAPYPGPAATPSYRATPQRPESFLFRNATREEANKAVTSLPASSSAPVNCTDDLSDNHNSTLPEEDVLVIEQLRKPKLTMAKCRRNVENFLEACRKIGVPQV